MKFFMFVLFAQIATAQAPKSGPVIIQTVGTSAFQVVTTREVKASKLLSQALRSEMQELLSSSAENDNNVALFEIAIFRESQSLGAVKVSPDELEQWISQAKSYLQKNREWRQLEVKEVELRHWVERKRVAESFLELKSNSLTSIITDQEIQDHYDKNRAKFGSTPLSEQKENIRRFLQKQSQKQRIQDWLTALKVKYQIRNDLSESHSTSEKPFDPPTAQE